MIEIFKEILSMGGNAAMIAVALYVLKIDRRILVLEIVTGVVKAKG